jgi:hypothetical protein
LETALRFFQETYDLKLAKGLRILLVANKEAYVSALIREQNINQKEAERRARTTSGWSSSTAIIQNVANLPTPRQRIFNMGHEVVHRFQAQVCAEKDLQRWMWPYEGGADALGARFVDMTGKRSWAEYREVWLKDLKKASKRPGLKELQGKEHWYTSLDKYGSSVPYRVAGLAMMELVKQKGYGPLFVYYKKLNDFNAETSFKIAFGLDLNGYENDFHTLLEKELASM